MTSFELYRRNERHTNIRPTKVRFQRPPLLLTLLSHHHHAMSRAETHNFAAGPSPLPTDVLEEAAAGLLNYNNTGMGVCELSHRGKEFKAIIEGAEGECARVLHACMKLASMKLRRA